MVADRGPELAAVLGLFLGLAWLFVGLRIYVKTFLTRNWGADDWLLILSLISFSVYASCSLTGVKYGTGRHIDDIPLEDIPRGLYYWWLCELFYTLTTLLIRFSVAIFILRICVRPFHRWIIYSTISIVLAFSIFYFFLVLFQCSPVSYFWGQYAGERGSCINPADVPDATFAHSAVSAASDWILGLLPVAVIWNLQMDRRTKVSVAAILGLGLLAGIATMIRVPYVKVLSLTDDFLYATTDVAIWSTVEPGVGLVAASAATLRPLFKTFYSLSMRGTNRSRSTRPTINRHSLAVLLRDRINPFFGHDKSANTSDDSVRLQKAAEQFEALGLQSVIVGPRSSDEAELNGSRKNSDQGIQVHRTLEITRTDDTDRTYSRGSSERGEMV